MAVAGIGQGYRAFRQKFAEQLDLGELDKTARTWVLRVCSFGLAARGLVFLLAGGFLVAAGLHSNPSKARGLPGALSSLHAQPLGRWLFAFTAVGLAAYGVFACVKARYGKIAQ